MYNLRYHMASLVAVFLALTIGLVLGGLVVGRGAIDDQQAQLINGLRDDLDELSAQNTKLEAQLGVQDAFAEEAARRMVAGQLKGTRVGVITNSGRSDGLAAAEDVIEAAGGIAVPLVLEKPGFGLEDQKVRSALPSSAVPANATVVSVAASLAAEWTGNGPRPVTDALVAAGVLDVDGLDDGALASVVTLAAFDGEPDAGGVSIAGAMKTHGAVGAGAQSASAQTGVAAAAAEAGLGATNILSTPAGTYSLVRLLKDGSVTGLYGIGSGVESLVPPITETSDASLQF